MRVLILATLGLLALPGLADAQCVGGACFSGTGFGGFRSRTVIRQDFRPMRFHFRLRQRQLVQSVPIGFSTGYESVQFESVPLMPVMQAPVVQYAPVVPQIQATPQAPMKAPPVPMKAPPLPSKNEPVPSAQIGPREP